MRRFGALHSAAVACSERVWGPRLTVVRALKLDFVTSPRHNGEEAIAICDSEWIEKPDGRDGQRQLREGHENESGRCYISDEREQDGGYGEPDGVEMRELCRAGLRLRWSEDGKRLFCFFMIQCFLFGTDRGWHCRREPRWYESEEIAVVEQENTEGEHEIVQKGVVCGEDYDDLPRSDDEKADEARTAREEHEKNDAISSTRVAPAVPTWNQCGRCWRYQPIQVGSGPFW